MKASSNNTQQHRDSKYKNSAMNSVHNEKGLASIEASVLMLLFIAMVYYSFGFFGIVHTGLIHNIHARTYAFETFRHRANLNYFRSNRPTPIYQYYQKQNRVHGINTDTAKNPAQQVSTERPITMGLELSDSGRKGSVHNSDIYNRVPASGRNTSVAVNPVWIMVLYGVCLNSECGG